MAWHEHRWHWSCIAVATWQHVGMAMMHLFDGLCVCAVACCPALWLASTPSMSAILI